MNSHHLNILKWSGVPVWFMFGPKILSTSLCEITGPEPEHLALALSSEHKASISASPLWTLSDRWTISL